MVILLRKLVRRLGDTVDAWDGFQQKDISYFLFDDEFQTASNLLKESVNAVDTVFLDLRGLLRQLQSLKKELCRDSPQGVSNLSYQNSTNKL